MTHVFDAPVPVTNLAASRERDAALERTARYQDALGARAHAAARARRIVRQTLNPRVPGI